LICEHHFYCLTSCLGSAIVHASANITATEHRRSAAFQASLEQIITGHLILGIAPHTSRHILIRRIEIFTPSSRCASRRSSRWNHCSRGINSRWLWKARYLGRREDIPFGNELILSTFRAVLWGTRAVCCRKSVLLLITY